jgi:hypothetical protein
MKAMRPDNPGCYWWKDVYGCYHTVDFDSVMEAPIVGDDAYLQYGSVDDFENMESFDHWVGLAHPPKEFASFPGRYFEGNNGVEEREMVLLDDVKEFRMEEE